MAVYCLRCRHFSRATGSRVTRAAAYRAGERIRDERTGEVHDYTDRQDIPHKEVVVPADLAGRADMAWTQDRSTLWNAVEHAGRRRNAHLAREWLVILPPELTADQRARLCHRFAQELADRYRCAVDLCIHLPRSGSDIRNHHAHLLMTTREISPEGLGRLTTLESNREIRQLRGLTGSSRDDYLALRERWARVTNEALQAAGLSARVDHRSLAHQGIGREPVPTIPAKVFYAEQRTGTPTAAGEAIRAQYRERVAARLEGPDALARVIERQKRERRESALEASRRRSAEPKRLRWGQLNHEERNARRREEYKERMQRDPEGVRAQRRRYLQAHRAEIRERKRRYRETHREALRRKKHEYYLANRERLLRKAREYSLRKRAAQMAPKSPPTPAEAAQRWKAYRDRNGPGPTAAESARNWKAYRESHGPGPTPEQSARNWLAFRERRRQAGVAQTPATRGRGQDSEKPSIESDDDRKRARKRDHDFSL